MEYSDYTIKALAMARDALKHMGTDRPERLSNLYADYAARLAVAFEAMDNAGVFAVLDEAVQSDQAELILAESALDDLEQELVRRWDTDPVPEAAVSRLGKLERVPGTDTLQPVHEHVFRSPHSDEICYGAEWCTVTYREHRRAVRIPEPEEVSDEWAARARAIESIRPKGRRSHGSLAADND